MRLRLLVPSCIAILLLVGLATAAMAADAAPASCQKIPGTVTAAVQDNFLFQAAGGEIGNPGEQSVCSAYCWDGSTASCYGTSCSAVDSSCPSQRGYCTGSSSGTRYCPACPCSATASCPGGGSVSCTGTSGCFAINNCYASCNGTLHWCPNPKYPCPI